MTFLEKFDYLKEKYASKADFSKAGNDFAVQITLTDEDCGGTFYIAYINKTPAIEPYNYNDYTVALEIDSVTFEEILKGKDAVKLFLDGKFNLDGNAEDALVMTKILSYKK